MSEARRLQGIIIHFSVEIWGKESSVPKSGVFEKLTTKLTKSRGLEKSSDKLPISRVITI